MNETIKYTSGRNARRDNTDDVLKIPSPSCGLTAEEAEEKILEGFLR